MKWAAAACRLDDDCPSFQHPSGEAATNDQWPTSHHAIVVCTTTHTRENIAQDLLSPGTTSTTISGLIHSASTRQGRKRCSLPTHEAASRALTVIPSRACRPYTPSTELGLMRPASTRPDLLTCLDRYSLHRQSNAALSHSRGRPQTPPIPTIEPDLTGRCIVKRMTALERIRGSMCPASTR